MDLLNMLGMLVRRFKEPSSWAGFSVLALACGMNVDFYNQLVLILSAVCGLIAMVLKEAPSDD